MQLLWPAWSWLDFPCLRHKNPQFHMVLKAVLSNVGLFEGHFVLTLIQPHAQQVGGLKNPNVFAVLGQQESCTQTMAIHVFRLH